MRMVLVLALCGACATDEIPAVHVVGDAREDGLRAVETWSELGFVGSLEDPGLPECDRTWYSDWFEGRCQITLDVQRIVGLSDDDVNGAEVRGKVDFDTREVFVNARLTGDGLAHTTAHEVGHILLDSMHLDSYLHPEWENVGVMQSRDSIDLVPTVNDYALACHTTGVCVSY